MTRGARLHVAVNARYSARPVTGVERVADELARRLPTHLDGASVTSIAPGRRLEGVQGHLWEQAVLPRAFHKSHADVLVSLANFGPIAVSRQVVLLHDVAPFLLPDTFDTKYAAAAKLIQRALARRCRLATVSERSRRDIASVFGIDPGGIGLVPPAVGPPFSYTDPGVDEGGCVFVGGHDKRKNLDLLLALWPEVQRACDATLHVVGRADSTTLAGTQTTDVHGVRWHIDPTDAELATLYRQARLVLSPSRYEGFGLPLLEGMACGTPFLATDTGAAAELAVAPDRQLLPLDRDTWASQLIASLRQDLSSLRSASLDRAKSWAWESSASRLATIVEETSRQSE